MKCRADHSKGVTIMAILEVNNVKKIYTTRFGGNQVQALSNINFSVEKGEYVAIMGESGSGKTTLLNILAALDKPTAGEVLLNGKNLVSVKEKEISAFRRNHLGFVFQDFSEGQYFSSTGTFRCGLQRDGTEDSANRTETWYQGSVRKISI